MDKPMSVFGQRWEGYEEKLRKNWEERIKEDDVVVLPGDFSWGMHLEETLDDFRFLNGLPGIKILSKGNHDYWWETANKLNRFVRE
jgi:predicted phosphohydrolase